MPTRSRSAALPVPEEQSKLALASQPSDNPPGPIRGVSHSFCPPIPIVRWATLYAGNQIGSEWRYVQNHGGLIEGRSKSAHGKGGKQCAIEYLDVGPGVDGRTGVGAGGIIGSVDGFYDR